MPVPNNVAHDNLDDVELARMFHPGADPTASRRYQVPDWPALHQELKRKGMTQQLLWEEYTEHYPNRCYSYSQFCDRYRVWAGKLNLVMRPFSAERRWLATRLP